ncbi:MAG: ATP-binding protein [Ruminococcus sp.]|nr:ATP-binding protein [Ruminococcus sp.]
MFKKKNTPDNDVGISAREKDNIRLKAEKAGKSKKGGKKEKPPKVKKTVQETLPYIRYCDDYILEVEANRYSKTYKFDDLNYSIATDEEQEGIFIGYCDVLNSFDSSVDIQMTVHNNKVNREDFNKRVLLSHRGNDEDFNRYIDVYNAMLLEKMEHGQSDNIRNKYITVSVQAPDLETAESKFTTIDMELNKAFARIGTTIRPLKSNERVHILKDVFRGVDEKIPELDSKAFKRRADRAYCCPDYFEFKPTYFMFNNKYARVVFIKDFPSSLQDDLITDIADSNLNVMTTVNISPVDPYKALKTINRQITSMTSEKIQAERKAIKSGYSPDSINYNLKYSLEQAKDLLESVQSKNQKIFEVNVLIMIISDSFEELENDTSAINAIVRKHICNIGTLFIQQEKGMQSVLPVGKCSIKIRTTLTTESTAVLLPFSGKELIDYNGMYYGQNTLSNNMILLNRLSLKNPNAFILGIPGGGKSFAGKREMLNVFLATDDDIIIIDPEREYTGLVKALKGEVINVSPTSSTHINPMDISADYSDDDSPIVMKSDFMLSFFECLAGREGLSSKERGLIDRCLNICYIDYLQDFDESKLPTLNEFYEVLKSQPEQEAKKLALSFELYIKGNLNIFAHKTNVDVQNRVICYDIKDLGKQLKTLGMLIVLDNIWNRVTMNRAKGKRTWIYLDEIYLLFANEHSANFLFELYKRARKWGGIPTGITQNVEDLLKSETARSMLANTEYIMMLSQSATDRAELGSLLGISDTLLSYVTNAERGCGLISYGGNIIPFKDEFPKNELYNLMTTKIEELQPT